MATRRVRRSPTSNCPEQFVRLKLLGQGDQPAFLPVRICKPRPGMISRSSISVVGNKRFSTHSHPVGLALSLGLTRVARCRQIGLRICMDFGTSGLFAKTRWALFLLSC